MTLIDILDSIGTIAFAVSGVLVAVKCKLDLFGVYVLSIITACGGGILRDIILGEKMPVFFTEPRYIVLITVTAVVTSLAYSYLNGLFQKTFALIQIFDAAGLGVFTILAAYKAINTDVPFVGVLFIAVVTGVGGGILRDTFVNEVPLVFKSEIYALASLLGAVTFYMGYRYLNTALDIYLSIAIIFIIRVLAMYYKVNLPVITIVDKRDNFKMKG